ncbi:hypothetical protein K439DRAFT_1552447 [Ramaria rubella]|nr:hypothetical protein K439DRAFT_1552447 [Ramaria rubella]
MLALLPSGHLDRGASLNNLADALETCFEQSGGIEDLDAAIMHHHVALDLCPSGHPDRGSSLNNLAVALETRFEQSGGIEDLDAAIMHHRTRSQSIVTIRLDPDRINSTPNRLCA